MTQLALIPIVFCSLFVQVDASALPNFQPQYSAEYDETGTLADLISLSSFGFLIIFSSPSFSAFIASSPYCFRTSAMCR